MRSKGGVSNDVRQSEHWKLNEYVGVRSVYDKETKRLNSFSGHERNKLFLSLQANEFLDASLLSGADSAADGRSFATLDYDHDGFQDIALVNTNDPHFELFRNNLPATQNTNGFVAIRFVGGNTTAKLSDEWACRDGYGAVATVSVDGKQMIRELRCGDGFASQNSKTIIVGIGAHSKADSVQVRWPSGREQSIDGVSSGSLVTFFEDQNQSPSQETGVAVGDYDDRKAGELVQRQSGPFLFSDSNMNDDGAKLRVFFTMATWCEACKRHLGLKSELKNRFADSDISFYGIPVDLKDDRGKLEQYQKELTVPYQILLDLDREQRFMVSQHIRTRFSTDAMPATIITDSMGNPVAEFLGVPSYSEVARLYDAISNQTASVKISK